MNSSICSPVSETCKGASSTFEALFAIPAALAIAGSTSQPQNHTFGSEDNISLESNWGGVILNTDITSLDLKRTVSCSIGNLYFGM